MYVQFSANKGFTDEYPELWKWLPTDGDIVDWLERIGFERETGCFSNGESHQDDQDVYKSVNGCGYIVWADEPNVYIAVPTFSDLVTLLFTVPRFANTRIQDQLDRIYDCFKADIHERHGANVYDLARKHHKRGLVA